MSSSTCIALLRGINVAGRNRVPMAELRELVAELGGTGVRSYIQSGNVVFGGAGPASKVEAELEAAIEGRFGLAVPVIVRPAEEWAAAMAGNPFPAASEAKPNLVVLALSKEPPQAGVVEVLRERATKGERVERVGDVLWIHYAGGVGRSKLSPGVLDRLAGSPVTTRNWRTVRRIAELAGLPVG